MAPLIGFGHLTSPDLMLFKRGVFERKSMSDEVKMPNGMFSEKIFCEPVFN